MPIAARRRPLFSNEMLDVLVVFLADVLDQEYIMKNWSSILERAIEDVNQTFGVNVTEYGRYLVKRGGRERRVADCHLDVEYERTDQALKAAWQRIADLPTQIADDVHVSTRVE